MFQKVVLLHTSTVTIVNPITGKSTLAYAHPDTALQATLISDMVRNEHDRETVSDPAVTIKTLSDQTTITKS